VFLKIVPEAGCDTALEKINQEQRSKDEKSTNGNEGELERNADAASVTIFRVVSVFKEANRNVSIIFTFTESPKNFKTMFACTESTECSH
jgi:hypothetical protein